MISRDNENSAEKYNTVYNTKHYFSYHRNDNECLNLNTLNKLRKIKMNKVTEVKICGIIYTAANPCMCAFSSIYITVGKIIRYCDINDMLKNKLDVFPNDHTSFKFIQKYCTYEPNLPIIRENNIIFHKNNSTHSDCMILYVI